MKKMVANENHSRCKVIGLGTIQKILQMGNFKLFKLWSLNFFFESFVLALNDRNGFMTLKNVYLPILKIILGNQKSPQIQKITIQADAESQITPRNSNYNFKLRNFWVQNAKKRVFDMEMSYR